MNRGSLDVDTISSRLQNLEKQNTAFKRLGITLLVGISALMLTGLAKPGNRIVEAEAFILKDSQGAAHGGLRIASTGAAHLELLSGRGGMIILAAHPSGNLSVAISDENGDPRVAMAVNSDGAPHIILNDAGLKPRVAIMSVDEVTSLVLDGGGGFQAGLMSGGQGMPTAGLALSLTERGFLAMLNVEPDGTPRIQLRSEEGEVLFDKP